MDLEGKKGCLSGGPHRKGCAPLGFSQSLKKRIGPFEALLLDQEAEGMGKGLFQESDLLVQIDLDLVLGAIGGVMKQTSQLPT